MFINIVKEASALYADLCSQFLLWNSDAYTVHLMNIVCSTLCLRGLDWEISVDFNVSYAPLFVDKDKCIHTLMYGCMI